MAKVQLQIGNVYEDKGSRELGRRLVVLAVGEEKTILRSAHAPSGGRMTTISNHRLTSSSLFEYVGRAKVSKEAKALVR